MAERIPDVSVAERLADRIAAFRSAPVPPALRAKCEELVIDVIGLCVTARQQDYVRSAMVAFDSVGSRTAIGHKRTFSAGAAAFVNGTAIHGEDFDDTFEGEPVHAGAVIVPAVFAACERDHLDGQDALRGIAVGCEVLCRLSLVAPKAVHKAGFHPTSVFGAMGAAAGVATALRLDRRQTIDALGVAGSMAGGINEYLAEGASTKRMHAGWAAQSGLRAALLGRAGFNGPRTVFEGEHGLFSGFARRRDGDFEALLGDFGSRWVTEALAFKPYPCGTMIHPYIDCARRMLGRGIKADDIKEIVCDTAESMVHRLWEPLGAKQKPSNGYGAKFSMPYCIAYALLHDGVGLEAFTDEAVQDPAVRALAGKIRFRVGPDNPDPREFTGHMRATLKDDSVVEEHQPHLRGGAHEPLTRADIDEKFRRNCLHGGWTPAKTEAALTCAHTMFSGPIDLVPLQG